MAISKIDSTGLESGGVTPSSLSTGAPSWDSSGNLSFNSGYGSVATAYGCRAWVNFNGQGTIAIRASGNVSSITDNGTGDYTVNFTTAMPNANYSVCCNAGREATNVEATWKTGQKAFATTSVRVVTTYGIDAALYDPATVSVSIFR